jgi:hypothetical protein
VRTVTVIRDPSGDFQPGAAVSEIEFRMTLNLGNWPDGIEIDRGGEHITVSGKHFTSSRGVHGITTVKTKYKIVLLEGVTE